MKGKDRAYQKKKGIEFMVNNFLPGVYSLNNKIVTKNLVPGMRVYGEMLFTDSGQEYREWVPQRSKLGAALKKGLKHWPFAQGSSVLYLGSAEGTTSSHVSDVIGEKGILFGVEISARAMRKFLLLCEQRKNLVPVLASANHPELYEKYVQEKVDAVFQDISQKNQVEIFVKNCKQFLKSGGTGLLVIKARSIDVSKAPRKVFEEQKKLLEKDFKVLQEIDLAPFEKDHAMFVIKN